MKKLVGLSLLLGAICISSMNAFAGNYCEDNNIKSPRTLYAEKSKTFTNDEKFTKLSASICVFASVDPIR